MRLLVEHSSSNIRSTEASPERQRRAARKPDRRATHAIRAASRRGGLPRVGAVQRACRPCRRITANCHGRCLRAVPKHGPSRLPLRGLYGRHRVGGCAETSGRPVRPLPRKTVSAKKHGSIRAKCISPAPGAALHFFRGVPRNTRQVLRDQRDLYHQARASVARSRSNALAFSYSVSELFGSDGSLQPKSRLALERMLTSLPRQFLSR